MKTDIFSEDTRNFLVLLEKYEVKYIIIGGMAVVYYGYPRLTGDVDFYYDIAGDNVHRLYQALQEFWENDIPNIEHEKELLEPGIIIQFGVEPNRIDLMNQIDGVDFNDAWKNKNVESIKMGNNKIRIYFIGRDQLIRNKKALGRNKDLDDLTFLKGK